MAITKNVEITVGYILNPMDEIKSVEVLVGEGNINISKVFTINNCYLKVKSLNGDKNIMHFKLGMYDSKKEILICEKSYSFIPKVDDSSENFIKQAYEYLKTLTEYADAVDVLEEGQMI